MKIEKVNDHQIRCTLTKADLADRELKISELAYGTEKAKNLFRDMMQQASFEFGFEAEDIPLMIEAIPLNADCIVLIITKVEDPEELDTRFSKFAPSVRNEDETEDHLSEIMEQLSDGADDVLDLFKKLHDTKAKETERENEAVQPAQEKEKAKASPLTPRKLKPKSNIAPAVTVDLSKIYTFNSISSVTKAAKVLHGYYNGHNSLFTNGDKTGYFLVVSKSQHTPEEFNKVCNILSEYGFFDKGLPITEAYLEEHGTCIIENNAIQSLCNL